MRIAFYAALTLFLIAFLGLGVGGFILASIMQRQKRDLADYGMKVSQATQLMLDLADFWWDYWWLIGLLVILPSFLLTVALGIALLCRPPAGS